MNETKVVILVGNLTILSVIGAMYGFNQNSKLRSEENNRITIGDKTATEIKGIGGRVFELKDDKGLILRCERPVSDSTYNNIKYRVVGQGNNDRIRMTTSGDVDYAAAIKVCTQAYAEYNGAWQNRSSMLLK